VKKKYAEANQILGDIVKVTPSSKIVGDLAQFMVQNKLSKKDVEKNAGTLSFPTSVIEFLQGMIGQPHGGFPEPFRSQVLKGLPTVTGRPGENMEPYDFDSAESLLKDQFGSYVTDRDVMSYALYPHVAKEFFKFKTTYGPVDKLETRHFLLGPDMGEEFDVTIEKGKTLAIKTLTPGIELTEEGLREVNFELNGQKRTVMITDENASASHTRRRKADSLNNTHIGAPMKGDVVSLKVQPGDEITEGQVVVVLSAMKMEMAVQSNMSGKIRAIHVAVGDKIDAEDLLVEVEED